MIAPSEYDEKSQIFFQAEYECSMYGSTLLKQLFITEWPNYIEPAMEKENNSSLFCFY